MTGPRHRRRRLHRLAPRNGAPRARRRGARARQLLDRLAREPRRARRRDRRGRAAKLRARPQRGARRRGRVPPRRARLGAALGAGPAHLERGQRRGDAQRAARRPRRGRSPGRLRLVDLGLRRRPPRCPRRRTRRSTRSRPTPSPSSPRALLQRLLAGVRLETVALRYFNVFGPRQSRSSQYAAVIPLFITAIAEGRPVTIYGDGEQSRDFTYIDNVVGRRSPPPTLREGERPGLQRGGRRPGERESRRRHDR